ncbi:condensation domain-containing protein [Nocardia mangyaensis]|uniref:condensation domain-containing protein n=1 Tax=Nocardia mangyaensis TaxID=2213200 RepID=UPI0026750A05|nr:condensation domain-containing protein [Nocardia mangyaensis]MDO3646556.1 condensation domain-containing protein [Nocardia mangyaensis]
MEYTHLSEFEIRSGALSIWTPELAAGAWQRDSRPLTSVHAGYCASIDPADPRPGRGRWIGTVFEMDAPFDASTWCETLRRWHARHEGLRTTVTVEPGSPPRRLVADATAVDIVEHPVDGLTKGSSINEFLCAALELRLSPLVWPHCVTATVVHAETADFTVLVAADHSVMDAYSQAILILELRAVYGEVAAGEASRASDTFGSAADFAVLERAAAAELAVDSPAVATWRAFLAGGDGMPRFAAHAYRPVPPDLPQPSVSRRVLELAELEHLEEALDRARHRMSVAVFAALAVAGREQFGTDRMRTVMPIATRPDLRWLESMGWFVNVVPVDIALEPGADIAGALESARTALRRSRAADDASWSRVLELLEVSETPRFGVSFLDIRVLPGYELVAALRGRTLRAVSYSPDEVFLWVVRAADGLYVSTRYPAGLPAEVMDDYLTAFGSALTSITSAPYPDAAVPADPTSIGPAPAPPATSAPAAVGHRTSEPPPAVLDLRPGDPVCTPVVEGAETSPRAGSDAAVSLSSAAQVG